MSYFTRRKQAFLPITLIDPQEPAPSARTSGNAAEGYTSWQDRTRMVWSSPISRTNAFLAADGEIEVVSNGVGFGTH